MQEAVLLAVKRCLAPNIQRSKQAYHSLSVALSPNAHQIVLYPIPSSTDRLIHSDQYETNG